MARNVAGVVLVGGRSSRMGRDKAMLDYNGRPLLDHMIGILEQAGLNDIYVSGELEGYRCIPDSAPHKGPAHAIADVLADLGEYDGALFVPVDMPLLSVDALRLLTGEEKGGYFKDSPLPAFVAAPYPKERFRSVKELLAATEACPVILPEEFGDSMINANTPEDWAEALRA